ncbi:MAG: DsbA family protein [Gammaproteobacteria bacterium]|nr:DsbA family protein [Gammaproteobacteria bacterium]
MGDIIKNSTLYYVHDPMCSWCWGFRPVWLKVIDQLKNIQIKYVLGGLATDTDEPMPEEMQKNIRETWQRIQKEIPGTRFNYDFWTQCKPRRSTYPACRAILAANNQTTSAGLKMLLAIQQAYYLNAQNPSDEKRLIQLAGELGLDKKQFESDLNSAETHKKLLAEFELRRKLKVYSFPSIVLEKNDIRTMIEIDYNHADFIIEQIHQLLDNN